MLQDTRVVIIEDDPYARDMIAMMLSRDWRTRVIGEFGCRAEAELIGFLKQPLNRVDVLIVDTEVPENPTWPDRVADLVDGLEKKPAVVYTCTYPRPKVLQTLLQRGARGYLVKSEILYSMASAVVFAAQGQFVITPSVLDGLEAVILPQQMVILSGHLPAVDFTQRESDIVRLGILFNLAQRDIADELSISTNWVAEAISNAYDKLELGEVVSGSIPLERYFEDVVLQKRIRAVLGRGKGVESNSQDSAPPRRSLRKAPWLSTIAFHLLTVPEVEES